MKRLTLTGTILALALAATATIALAGSGASAWLGVYTQAVDADLAEAFSLKVDYGAIINEVVEDSPADEAGLREDDIILTFNGDRVGDDEGLIDLVADAEPGDKVKLTVFRDGKEMDVEAELGKRPRSHRSSGWDDFRWFSAPQAPNAPKAPRAPRFYSYQGFDSDDEYAYIGVSLLEVSERTAKSLGSDRGGVLIDDVAEDSPAEKAGLEPGDLIVAVDSDEVFDASDVQEIVRSMDEGDIAKIEIIRNHDRSTIEVPVELTDGPGSFGGYGVLRLPDLPNIDFNLPKMKGLHHGYSIDRDLFDSDEYQAEMKELQKQMAQLKKELRALKKSLE